MLRQALLVASILLIAAGFFVLSMGEGAGLSMAGWGIVLLVAILVERWRYRESSWSAHSDRMKPTAECFVDSKTGKTERVYYDAETGEREYREEP